jgi:hypothetical protein
LPILIVGDVHGDLERLFTAIRPYPPDHWRTIFLGDLVDGGPFGVGALRYAHDRPNSRLVLGNHEVLMLAALEDREERGPNFRSWVETGGQLHDLDELARDEPLQGWLRELPLLRWLEDRTLVQHCDSDAIDRLVPNSADPVTAINDEARRMLAARDHRLLIDLLSQRRVFRDQPLRLDSWLRRTGARRIVHGHTPHGRSQPDVYAGGRAISFDGGLGRWGGRGNRGRAPGAASVGPLPP